MDFTYETYRDLLDAGCHAGYDFLTIREYIARHAVSGRSPVVSAASGTQTHDGSDAVDTLPERFIILRHDVDRKPENSLAKAKVEAAYGIASTYYVRTVERTFDPAIIREIDALGHEVGYHYEDMDRADGDTAAAIASFETELARLRELVEVDTVCMHGNPLSAHDNRDMWADTSFEPFDLLGEAYLSLDFTDVTYFSDTGRTWADGALKIKDHTRGQGRKDHQVGTTHELIELLESGELDRLCLLTHPNRWAKTYPEFLVETTKDRAINVVKRGLNLVT